MSDYLTSLIRTIVPTVVGAALAWLIANGVDLDPATAETDVNQATAAALSTALIAVCIGAYYAAARALEQRWPQAGWLLGAAQQPTYRGEPDSGDGNGGADWPEQLGGDGTPNKAADDTWQKSSPPPPEVQDDP